jgi:hypothetical protein
VSIPQRKSTEAKGFFALFFFLTKEYLTEPKSSVIINDVPQGALTKYRDVAQLGDVAERPQCGMQRGKRSGSRRRTPANLFAQRDAETATGRARSAPQTSGRPFFINSKPNIEMWLSLVERVVREQITDYERKNSKTAENP